MCSERNASMTSIGSDSSIGSPAFNLLGPVKGHTTVAVDKPLGAAYGNMKRLIGAVGGPGLLVPPRKILVKTHPETNEGLLLKQRGSHGKYTSKSEK